MKNASIFHWVNHLDAHFRLYFGIGTALLTGLIMARYCPLPLTITGSWLAFALTNLFFSWVTILTSHPIEMRKIAKIQDSNRTLIFLIVLSASLISLFAVILLLKSTTGKMTAASSSTTLSFASVLCAWWLVHTIFTFRYAHLFYSSIAAVQGQKSTFGGLEFPNETQPDYLDFTYFAFVIGMTFQVSDVEISSRRIRRLALLHGVVSFIFNTFILALSINVILSILQH